MMMEMDRETTRVVVLGAGYAGLRAALRIARRTRRENVRVELINAADTFVERIRLHQLATGQRLARRPIRAFIRGTGIEFQRVHHVWIQVNPDKLAKL